MKIKVVTVPPHHEGTKSNILAEDSLFSDTYQVPDDQREEAPKKNTARILKPSRKIDKKVGDEDI